MDKAALKEALYEDAVEQLREGGTLGQKLCRSVCPAASVKIQFFCLSRPTLQAAGRKVWKTRSWTPKVSQVNSPENLRGEQIIYLIFFLTFF